MKIAWFDNTSGKHRIDNLREELKDRGHEVMIRKSFDKNIANGADIVWAEHLTFNARDVTNGVVKKPILIRVSAMEMYKQRMGLFDWSKVCRLVVQGKHLKEYFLENYGKLDKNKIAVIGGGIDMDKFEFSKKEKGNKIAVVSEIHWRKGVQLIPEVLSCLNKKYEVYHIGKLVNRDCKNYLDWKLKDLGLEDRYFYEGTVGKVEEWLRDKSYLLHCSYTEGLARAIGEAMSVGLKPLVFGYRGAREQWPGFVWEKPEQVKDMLDVYEPEKYREFVKENRSIKNTADKVENLLKEIK